VIVSLDTTQLIQLLIGSYIVQIFRSPKLNSNVLYAAFCLYLMIALYGGLHLLF